MTTDMRDKSILQKINEQILSSAFQKRFWEKVHKTDTCWIWTAYRSPKGYGTIGISIPVMYKVEAHRVSWIIAKGDVPDGLLVLHNCPGWDNPACVNPNHLWLGTNQENLQDLVNKRRKKAGIKDSSVGQPTRKVTPEIVRAVRAEWESSIDHPRGSLERFAEKFRLKYYTVCDIVRYKCYNSEPYKSNSTSSGQMTMNF